MDPYIQNFALDHIDTIEFDKVSNIKGPENNFKILHLNIRSISHNFDHFLCLLNQLNFSVDIIVLTETHFIVNKDLFGMDGYQLIYNEGTLNKCDGTIVYIKKSLGYTHSFAYIGEIKVIETEVDFMLGRKITLSCIYRSPSIEKKVFNENFIYYLNSKKHIKNHIIVGDMNMDLLSVQSDDEEYKNIFNLFYFTSFINKVTRPQSQTCLDHLLVKMSTCHGNISKPMSYILKYNITDHFPIGLMIPTEKKSQQEQTNKNIKKFINLDKLKQKIANESWRTVFSSHDPNVATNIFLEILKSNIDQNTNILRMSNRRNGRQNWITRGLLNLINRKQELYLQCSREPHNQILKNQYKYYNNLVNREVKEAKRSYFQRQISNNENRNKTLWNCVNDICNGQSKNDKKIKNIVLEGGRVLNSDKDISEYLNRYFCDIGHTLASSIAALPDIPEEPNFVRNSIFLYPTTEREVEQTIDKLKKRKQPGIDGIRSETLQFLSKEISKPLAYIINICFQSGTFPDSLKIAAVSPIHKNGSKESVNNYRPISLVSNLAKIFEMILKHRLLGFLDRYSVLSDKQYGFREKKSTEDAIMKLTSYLYDAIDQSDPSLCIFVDLSKAFDTVDHSILLRKLKNHGIRGPAHKVITSYLTNRKQMVTLGDAKSSLSTVTCGVPQGTVLGPLLFIIYVNSLLRLNLGGKIISFADDTAIFYRDKTWAALRQQAEGDFKSVSLWFQQNKLSLNVSKTKYIPFASYVSGLPDMGPLDISQNISIPSAVSMKYLGLTLDSNLKWDAYAQELTMKLRCLIPKFKRLKDFLDQKYLKIIYYSLVQSHLTYGLAGWGGIRDCHLSSLEVVQKWLLKIIFNKNILHSTDLLFSEMNIFDLRQLYFLNLVINIHKEKIYINQLNHPYPTRSQTQGLVAIPKRNKSVGQRYFNFYAPKAYNMLPDSLKKDIKGKAFAKNTKKWMHQADRHIFHDLLINT